MTLNNCSVLNVEELRESINLNFMQMSVSEVEKEEPIGIDEDLVLELCCVTNAMMMWCFAAFIL